MIEQDQHAATQDDERLAYHEAGHALAACLFRQPFSYVTIESNGLHAGHIRWDENVPIDAAIEIVGSRNAWIVTLLAGMAAELEMCGAISADDVTGAAGDIRDVALIAACDAQLVDVLSLLAFTLMHEHRQALTTVAESLVQARTLRHHEVLSLMDMTHGSTT